MDRVAKQGAGPFDYSGAIDCNMPLANCFPAIFREDGRANMGKRQECVSY